MTDSTDLETLAEQERTLHLPRLDSTVAFHLGLAIRSAFLSQPDAVHTGIVISIHLFTGHVLFSCSVGDHPSVGPDNWDWIRRKSATVQRYGKSSLRVGRELLAKGRGLDYLDKAYAAHGGAFPLVVRGNRTGPVGVVAVSGLKQEEDHRLVVEGLRNVMEQLEKDDEALS